MSFAISLFSVVSYGDELDPMLTALPTLARSAKEQFIIRTPAELERSRQLLVGVVRRLDRYLTRAGANGRAWKSFLKWEDLQRQLSDHASPDLVVLDGVYQRFHSGHTGLELPMFHDVAKALRSYRHLAEQVSNSGFRAEYEARLEALAEGLEGYQQAAETQRVEAMGEAIGWLDRHAQAPQVVRATRNLFGQANLHMQISQELIAAGSGRTIDETAPVRDLILGTSISGTGRTVGRASVHLVPDARRAVIETTLDATNYARTVGRNGPAIIYSTGETRILGSKRFSIDADGLRGSPATSSARTRTRVTGVGSTKRRVMDRVVRHVAQKKIPKQKSASEQIAARHAERKFNDRLEGELGGMLAKANLEFQRRFRDPLVRRDEFPRLLRFSTTAAELRCVALHDGPSRLAAPSAPPEIAGRPGLAVRLHESLVNNLATGLLAGRTLDQEQVEQLAVDILGKVPPQLVDEEQREPWAITFASSQPITLHIEQQTVTMTIRGRRFSSGSRRFDAMNVTARYRLENAGGAVKAVRLGELEIFPPGFVPGEGKLPPRLATIRNLLKHRFERIFTEEIVSQGLVLPGQMSKAGKLDLTQFEANRGWVTLAWERGSSDERGGKGDLASDVFKSSQSSPFSHTAVPPWFGAPTEWVGPAWERRGGRFAATSTDEQ
jgi:hypothetical protein